MIQTSCPSCNRALKLAENLAGKQIRCPACKHVFRVEAPAAAEAVVEEVAPPRAAPPPRPAARPAPPPVVAVEPGEAAPAPRRRPPPAHDDFDDYEGAPPPFDEKAGRRAARRGAGSLQMAFIFSLIAVIVFFAAVFITGGGRGGRGRGSGLVELGLGIIYGLGGLYIVQTILILVGAILLGARRGKGMVITAAVICFVLSLQLLIYGGVWLLALLQLAGLGAPMDVLIIPLVLTVCCFAALILNILGGIRALITLGKPEVKSVYNRG